MAKQLNIPSDEAHSLATTLARGDCMAYAIAKAHGIPLLYKGDDFAHTDVASALP